MTESNIGVFVQPVGYGENSNKGLYRRNPHFVSHNKDLYCSDNSCCCSDKAFDRSNNTFVNHDNPLVRYDNGCDCGCSIRCSRCQRNCRTANPFDLRKNRSCSGDNCSCNGGKGTDRCGIKLQKESCSSVSIAPFQA